MKNLKKITLFSLCIMSLCIILLLSAFLIIFLKPSEPAFMGSFTYDKTYSYDEKYYATQKSEDIGEAVRFIKVSIYETETNTLVFNFYPARTWDFWGICWENDTYNIWTQSGDIGVHCYKYENEQWERDYSAKRPEYIISRYDKYDKVEDENP